MVDGFCNVDVTPLPRFQDQLVGVLLLLSVKLTNTGEHPALMLVVKLAVGACANDGLGRVQAIHNNSST